MAKNGIIIYSPIAVGDAERYILQFEMSASTFCPCDNSIRSFKMRRQVFQKEEDVNGTKYPPPAMLFLQSAIAK